MKLAVVGWATDSGVGRELIDALSFLPVDCAFILNNPQKPMRKDRLKIPHTISNNCSQKLEMETFLKEHKPTTVLTWEVPGHWDFPEVWEKAGVKWVHVVHWDWFIPSYKNLWQKAHLIAPNKMCQRLLMETCGLKSTHLPVPVDTTQLTFRQRKRANSFVSVYGYGGFYDRRSVPEINAAWRLMKDPPILTVMAQKDPLEFRSVARHPRIKINVANVKEPNDLYQAADIAVQPSRYEGVGLSMVEAQACGVPVIAVNAEPMNEVVLPDLLIPAERTLSVEFSEKTLPSYVPSIPHLKALVERLRGSDISDLSLRCKIFAEKYFSWNFLMQKWLEILR